jgi:hypothetical protein
MRAILNLEAIYKTTANPGVLLENATANKKVPVEVVIGLRGNLSNPEPNFDINFPTVSSVLKSEIQTKLDDKDVRQKQALILLSTGGFLSDEGLSQSALTSNLYEKVGDLLGSVFNDDADKINIGVDLAPAEHTRKRNRRALWRDRNHQSQRTHQHQRKLGVPVGGINESAVVGDVEVQYRVNEDGTMYLRAFNKENDINYIGQGIGYTQGLGITYEVDFDTFTELVNRIFKGKAALVVQPTEGVPQDSDLLPDFIRIKDARKTKAKKAKTSRMKKIYPRSIRTPSLPTTNHIFSSDPTVVRHYLKTYQRKRLKIIKV